RRHRNLSLTTLHARQYKPRDLAHEHPFQPLTLLRWLPLRCALPTLSNAHPHPRNGCVPPCGSLPLHDEALQAAHAAFAPHLLTHRFSAKAASNHNHCCCWLVRPVNHSHRGADILCLPLTEIGLRAALPQPPPDSQALSLLLHASRWLSLCYGRPDV